jgi:hypothetical protein
MIVDRGGKDQNEIFGIFKTRHELAMLTAQRCSVVASLPPWPVAPKYLQMSNTSSFDYLQS